MRRTSHLLSVLILCLVCLTGRLQTFAAEQGALQLTLPETFPAVVGEEMSLYFDNVILTENPEAYRFEVECAVGTTSARRWSVTPKAEDVGSHKLTLTVRDAGNQPLARGSTTLRVVPADAGKGRTLRLLVVGDSLTNATVYPNELARLLSQPGNPEWKMLGTHRPGSAAEGVAHEGYGGWTWQRFVAHYEPNPDEANRKRSSPFVFLGEADKPALNVGRYFEEKCGGERPDVVFFLLGINDCFSANPDDPKALDTRIDEVFRHAETLLAAFRAAAPEAELAICLVPAPNTREGAFEANYKGRYPRWGWKRIQHRLVQRQLQHFSGREKERIFVVPTELNIDPIDGYPENNAVHPNAFGYRQIAASLYAWWKTRAADAPGSH